MSESSPIPKRHHWWPKAQSRYWTGPDGMVFVTRKDGSTFRTGPDNIGVESELYTRFNDEGEKDVRIEEWFAETIDGPVAKLIDHFLDPGNVRRRPFRGDSEKAKTVTALGFRVHPYIDEIKIHPEIRTAISEYLSALLVRHPTYLAKLLCFHKDAVRSDTDAKNRALDNMLYLYGVYSREIAGAVLMVSRITGTAEYLYADGGLSVEEPWRSKNRIPFDIHAPLTPEITIDVLPLPFHEDLSTASIWEATNQGVARQNRIILGAAKRFVFSRQAPPVKFIVEHFGQPTPKNIGYRIVNGRLETHFDPTRS